MIEAWPERVLECAAYLRTHERPQVRHYGVSVPALRAGMNQSELQQAFSIAEFLVIERGFDASELNELDFYAAATACRKGESKRVPRNVIVAYTRTLSNPDVKAFIARLARTAPAARNELLRSLGALNAVSHSGHTVALQLTDVELEWLYVRLEGHVPGYRRPVPGVKVRAGRRSGPRALARAILSGLEKGLVGPSAPHE